MYQVEKLAIVKQNFRLKSIENYSECFFLDIITYDNKLVIKNFSRTAPMNYQCIADNGIPPRDTRNRHLVPASKHLSFAFSLVSN